MRSDFVTFIEYIELRRRIELRLVPPLWLLLHSVVFMIVSLWIALNAAAETNSAVDPSDIKMMGLWSAILGIHGWIAYYQSGAYTVIRDREVKEVLHSANLNLKKPTKADLRLQGILHEDIRQRASMIPPLLILTLINAALWLAWYVVAPQTAAFLLIPVLFSMTFLVIMAATIYRRARHEIWLRGQLSDPAWGTGKTKNITMELGEDGELIELDEEILTKDKRQSR